MHDTVEATRLLALHLVECGHVLVVNPRIVDSRSATLLVATEVINRRIDLHRICMVSERNTVQPRLTAVEITATMAAGTSF